MKTWVAIVSCVVSAGVASAQPKAPAKPAAPCLPTDAGDGSARLVPGAGSATLCVKNNADKPVETCFSFSQAAAPKPAPVPPPVVEKRVSEVKLDGGTWAVCTAGTCKPVGKKLASALVGPVGQEKTNDSPAFLARATDDGKLVAVGSDLWVVASDKKLKLKAPKEYKGNIDKPSLGGVEIVGNAVIANWYNCAGPCTQAVLVDAKGANRGKWFGGGVALQLDAKRLAVLSIESANELVVIDLPSAKQTSRLAIDMGGVTPATAAKIDESTVVIAYQTMDGWTVTYASAPAGKAVSAGASYKIAGCPM